MKFSARILALLLMLTMLLGMFVGCTENGEVASATLPPSNASDESPEAKEEIEINADNISEYKLVVPAEPSSFLTQAVTSFNSDVKDMLGKEFIKVSDTDAKSEKEIVIGLTCREDSVALTNELLKDEYGVIAKGESVYVIGFNDLCVEEALEYFVETYIDPENKTISLSKELTYYKTDKLLKKVMIDGVSIENYKIIIPDNADVLTQYAAENLSDYFANNGVGALTVSKDTVEETEYEILIGDTNRSESNVSVSTGEGEYILYKSKNKIVCRGDDIWVGGGAGTIIGKLPSEGTGNVVNITDIPTEPIAKKFEFKEAKNVVYMIGDGTGFNTVDMFKADTNEAFYAEYMTNKGNAYTGSYTTAQKPSEPTDSAAGGTALSSGYKTVNGYIGVTPEQNAMPNIRELAHMRGSNTAVLTTDAITGATPSAFLIHHKSRNDTTIIQNRINELINNKSIDICQGSITSLKTITANSLNGISQNGENFFIMIEEGHIDKRSHSNDRTGCVDMVERFNDTIAYVIEFVICHPDTVLIITADHETGGITKNADGTFVYTTKNHSTQNVPVYAFGYGTEYFNDKEVDNTDIPKFISKIYGAVNFGVEK